MKQASSGHSGLWWAQKTHMSNSRFMGALYGLRWQKSNKKFFPQSNIFICDDLPSKPNAHNGARSHLGEFKNLTEVAQNESTPSSGQTGANRRPFNAAM